MADQENAAGGNAPEPKRLDFTIQNIGFSAEAIYAPGHQLNEAEANVLNQTRVENLRNNFAGVIKGKLAELAKETPPRSELTEEEIENLRSQFAEYESSYEFQGRRATRVPVDPVKREATKMAREAIIAALKKKGLTPGELVEGKMEELISGYLGAHPEVTDEAKRRVEAVKSLAEGAGEEINLGEDDLKPTEEPKPE